MDEKGNFLFRQVVAFLGRRGDCRGRVANPHGFGVPKREKWGKKCFSNGQNERRSFTSVLSSPCEPLCLKRDLALLTTEDLGDCCGSDFSVFVGVFLCFVFCVCKFNYFQQKPKIKTSGEDRESSIESTPTKNPDKETNNKKKEIKKPILIEEESRRAI